MIMAAGSLQLLEKTTAFSMLKGLMYSVCFRLKMEFQNLINWHQCHFVKVIWKVLDLYLSPSQNLSYNLTITILDYYIIMPDDFEYDGVILPRVSKPCFILSQMLLPFAVSTIFKSAGDRYQRNRGQWYFWNQGKSKAMRLVKWLCLR